MWIPQLIDSFNKSWLVKYDINSFFKKKSPSHFAIHFPKITCFRILYMVIIFATLMMPSDNIASKIMASGDYPVMSFAHFNRLCTLQQSYAY